MGEDFGDLLCSDQYWQKAYQKVFSRTKLHIKRNIIKLSQFWGQFSRTALGIDVFCVKYCSVLKQSILYQTPVAKVSLKQGRKRPLDTLKRMIDRREREGEREIKR